MDDADEYQKRLDGLSKRIGELKEQAAEALRPLSVTSQDYPSYKPLHDGTKIHNAKHWDVIKPSSIPGSNSKKLEMTFITARVKCYFFEAVDFKAAPRYFAAAAAPELTDFSNVNFFFHPNPGHAGMEDKNYPDTGKWLELFRYAPYNGYQIVAASKKQILIMPFLKNAHYDTAGDLGTTWKNVATDIAKLIKADLTNDKNATATVQNVVVSSFSQGIKPASAFVNGAVDLSGLLREIWDLDGMSSDSKALSVSLRNAQKPRLLQLQQALPELSGSYNVSVQRWYGVIKGLETMDQKVALKTVHGKIGQTCYYPVATWSNVGK